MHIAVRAVIIQRWMKMRRCVRVVMMVDGGRGVRMMQAMSADQAGGAPRCLEGHGEQQNDDERVAQGPHPVIVPDGDVTRRRGVAPKR